MDIAATASQVYRATWGRAFASMYASMITRAERGPLGAERTRLLGDLKGDVIEIGAGTGVNLVHYGRDVTSITVCEPEPAMFERLERAASGTERSVRVIQAAGESLPLETSSADVVVSTLVLCTVRDLDATLVEIARVLRPGGLLVVLEHVRSSSPKVAQAQDLLRAPWAVLGYGCQCNRDTVGALARHGFATEALSGFELVGMTPLIKTAVTGVATAPH